MARLEGPVGRTEIRRVPGVALGEQPLQQIAVAGRKGPFRPLLRLEAPRPLFGLVSLIQTVVHEREALRRQERPVPEAAFARARGDQAFQGARRPAQLVRDDDDGVAARRLERRAALVQDHDVRVVGEASHELRERLAAPDFKARGKRRPLGGGARDAAREVPRGLLRKESPPRLPQFKALLRRRRLAVVLEGPLQLQRKRLLVRGEASDFRSHDARCRVAERQMQRRVRADAVAVPQCRRRAAAQHIDAALQKIVDGELTVRDG